MVIGILTLLAGLMVIIFQARSLSAANAMMHPDVIRTAGVLGAAIGAILIAAALKRAVGLRLFVLMFGVYMLVVCAVVFAAPDLMIDLVNALLFKRSSGAQSTVLWLGGLLRIAIGGALLWAAARPPCDSGPAPVEHH